ncbi:hypothetical protein C1H46_008373 [Malus baccata]|uniref:Protein kinase domain-containing protein n=1 Tax=Malus baccata TaxID=106549 RepID=A0A540N681_MALBA|nr:hypothetical protein C1H46_008373 [Malus baccata]
MGLTNDSFQVVWALHRERQLSLHGFTGVLKACHSLGVNHWDLKPENFLFVNQKEDAPLKTIDFGLSVFFRPD